MNPVQQTLLERAEELAQIGSWDWDLISGRVVWSDNLFRLFGLQPGEIEPSAESLASRFHPDDIADIRRRTDRARVTGDMEPLSFRILRADGEVRHMRSTIATVEQQDGQAQRIIGAMQDLTDRYRADRNVAAHLAVSETLADWDALDDGTERLVSTLGAALGCVVGMMWVPEGTTLVLRSFWHMAGLDASAIEERLYGFRLAPNAGLPGRAWESREAASSVRLVEDSHESLRDLVTAMGLTGAMAIPAVHREEVLAVISFYSKDDLLPTDRLLRSLTGIGYELGMFLDRHRGELGPPELTPREVEVLQLAAQGLAVKAIAGSLGVSPATVRTHFEHIYAKYGVSGRAAAVAKGMREGVIQ
jgi:PAS domain S-box-containing protein